VIGEPVLPVVGQGAQALNALPLATQTAVPELPSGHRQLRISPELQPGAIAVDGAPPPSSPPHAVSQISPSAPTATDLQIRSVVIHHLPNRGIRRLDPAADRGKRRHTHL
jgi:hypothetical protein